MNNSVIFRNGDIFYSVETDELILCIGKSTLVGFKRFMVSEKPMFMLSRSAWSTFVKIGRL